MASKPKAMKLVFVASLQNMQNMQLKGVRAKIVIICQCGETCLPVYCCFNEQHNQIHLSVLV
jgi:hypothetical protein